MNVPENRVPVIAVRSKVVKGLKPDASIGVGAPARVGPLISNRYKGGVDEKAFAGQHALRAAPWQSKDSPAAGFSANIERWTFGCNLSKTWQGAARFRQLQSHTNTIFWMNLGFWIQNLVAHG